MTRPLFAALLGLLEALLAACGPVPHPFGAHKENALVDDRRVTASVQITAPPQFPGLAEAVVTELAKQDVLATTRNPGRRAIFVRGGIESGNLVWRLSTPERRELGVLSQAMPPGADIGSLAREAAPLIVQLLTAEGSTTDSAHRARVAVRPVRGPPGMDTRALSQAMVDALSAQGVATGGDDPLVVVEGELRVLPGNGSRDVVQVDWTVRDAKGRSLGTVSQGNPMDRTTLIGPLDQMAHDIATAAAPGVIEVIRRKVPTALEGG